MVFSHAYLYTHSFFFLISIQSSILILMVTYHYYNTKLGASFAIKVDYLMYWRIYVRVWIIIIFNERTTIVCISNKFLSVYPLIKLIFSRLGNKVLIHWHSVCRAL